jgi:glycosyltransferase involved in cell wall biosynthesis
MPSAIAVVVPYNFNPPTSGGQRVCYNLCTALASRIGTICVSCNQTQQQSRVNITEVLRKSILKYFDPFSIVNLIRVIKCHQTEICIVNHPFFFIPAFIACRITRRKLITYAHNLEYRRRDGLKRYFKPLLFAQEWLAYRFSDCVFFISNAELKDALDLFGLDRNNCYFVPHIVHQRTPGSPIKSNLRDTFNVTFFGDFAYGPNREGLEALLKNIVPLLESRIDFPCRISIFGNNLPTSVGYPTRSKYLEIEFLGLIEDHKKNIESADVMINPVRAGAGVQTKIIEALSLGTTVVSAQSGARGIIETACGDKLVTVEDCNWLTYVDKLVQIKNSHLYLSPTPNSFFSVYSEDNVMNTVTLAFDTLREQQR